MPTTNAQDRRIQDYEAEYDTLRVTPSTGPSQDRAVVSCPDGRTIIVGPDGRVLADSARRFYRPDVDALLVRQGEDDYAFVPPPASGLMPMAFVPLKSALEMAGSVIEAVRRRTTEALTVWVVEDGELKGPFRPEGASGWRLQVEAGGEAA